PEVLDRLRRHEKHCVAVSARTGEGLAELRALIAHELPKPDIEVEVLVPYDRGDLISRLHDEADVLESEHVAEGTRVRAKVTPAIEADLTAYVVVAS
ncbi:MAG: GTPase HflX, partial [Dermatophilaceae bacterium]|nr:GTPase HflX [Dermatophilaceae bacterium]